MNTDLVVASTIGAVSTALDGLLRTLRQRQFGNGIEAQKLRDALMAARALEMTGHVGRLVRANIDEIVRTQAVIDECAPRGRANDYAVAQLQALHRQLLANMEWLGRA